MKFLLLALVSVIHFQVTVERVNDTLVFSAPKLQEGKYGEVWIQPASSEIESLSPNSWQIVSDATSGTFSVVICGDDFCRIEECDWSLERPIWRIGFLVLVWVIALVYTILLFRKTSCKPVRG